MGVFHVFKIVQMVPNRTKHHKLQTDTNQIVSFFITWPEDDLFFCWKNFDVCSSDIYDSYFFYFQTFSELRIHWRLSTIIKSVWSNVFWYVKVCIFLKCIQYTIRWDKTQMFKKLPSAKINGTKNALFFLSRNPAHHSFTFN